MVSSRYQERGEAGDGGADGGLALIPAFGKFQARGPFSEARKTTGDEDPGRSEHTAGERG